MNWAIGSGGGTLGAATSATNSTGEAKMGLTVGSATGANTVVASLASGAAVTFTATSTYCAGANLTAEPFATGLGTGGSPYILCTPAQLNRIGADATYVTKVFNLGKSIDMSGVTVTMIGSVITPFQSTFDGAGFSIYNVSITATADYVGLFSVISGATVKNLTIGITAIDASAYDYVGALIGQSDATTPSLISNVSVTGTGAVIGKEKVGGLIGDVAYHASLTTVSLASAKVSVSGQDRVGGLIGSNTGTVTKSFSSTGTVTVTAGGMGMVTGGGLIGFTGGGPVSQCYSTSDVYAASGNVGGFVGGTNCSIITDSYAQGNVVSDSMDEAAAFMPYHGGSCNPERVYATGRVSGSVNLKFGLLGSGASTATDSFWDSETTEQATSSGGGTAKTTAQMKTATTFTNASWDNSAIWNIVDGSYPTLK